MNKIGKAISITMVLAILTYIFVMPAAAALLGKDGFYYEFVNGDAVLKEYHSSNTEVNIPPDVYQHKVVAIADYVFLRNTNITSVTVPDTVTTIGNSAFYGCNNLERIVIPASVISFGNSVFANCENITIECYSGSTAETYAINNNTPYILIDGSDPIDTESDTDTDSDSDTDTETDSDIKIYQYGDVDLDGKINSGDSLLILRRSVKLEDFNELQEKLADVDGDKIPTSADALDVLRYSVKLSVQSQVGEELIKE